MSRHKIPVKYVTPSMERSSARTLKLSRLTEYEGIYGEYFLK